MSAVKPITHVQIAAFLKRNWPGCRADSRDVLLSRIGWHHAVGKILTVVDEAGRLCGVALGRFINSPEQGPQNYVHHEDGRLVWVDVIACRRREAITLMVAEMIRRWGKREAIGGNVFNRAGELRMFPMNRLQQFFGG